MNQAFLHLFVFGASKENSFERKHSNRLLNLLPSLEVDEKTQEAASKYVYCQRYGSLESNPSVTKTEWLKWYRDDLKSPKSNKKQLPPFVPLNELKEHMHDPSIPRLLLFNASLPLQHLLQSRPHENLVSYLNTHHVLMVVGQSNSGKTSLCHLFGFEEAGTVLKNTEDFVGKSLCENVHLMDTPPYNGYSETRNYLTNMLIKNQKVILISDIRYRLDYVGRPSLVFLNNVDTYYYNLLSDNKDKERKEKKMRLTTTKYVHSEETLSAIRRDILSFSSLGNNVYLTSVSPSSNHGFSQDFLSPFDRWDQFEGQSTRFSEKKTEDVRTKVLFGPRGVVAIIYQEFVKMGASEEALKYLDPSDEETLADRFFSTGNLWE